MLRRSLVFICAIVFTPQAWAADPSSAALRPMPAPNTDTFLAKTIAANTFEIESSKLAVAKTHSDAVRAFASRMIKDHVRLGTEFEQAVSDAGLKLPPARMDSQGRFTCDDLRSKLAADLDKEYVQAQYNGHAETVAMFRAYANSGEDARLKRFAAETLPILEAHLAEVKKLRK